ncbi:MAG: YqgE/AlgH family protein [Bdellovibrionales bacterium]
MKDILSHTKTLGKASDKLEIPESPSWLTGQLLVAMPGMGDPRFTQSVIYICSHGPSGAMGLIVNRLFGDADFPMLLEQLNIEAPGQVPDIPVQFGGPVEVGRGFVLHSSEYMREGTTRIDDVVSVTATIEIIQDIARGKGPERALMVLGYAGWGGGQLEEELKSNGWLTVGMDEEILFDRNMDTKWERAMAKIGITPAMLSDTQGNA